MKEPSFDKSTIMGKGEEQKKDNPVSEGDMNRPKLLWDIAKEFNSDTEADQEGEDQEGG